MSLQIQQQQVVVTPLLDHQVVAVAAVMALQLSDLRKNHNLANIFRSPQRSTLENIRPRMTIVTREWFPR